MRDTIVEALTPVADAFDALSIPYFIGGSVAALFYQVERATNDIDLIAEVRPEHATPLEARLGNDYYADAQMIRQAVMRRSSFNFIHFATGLKIDVFLLKDTPFMHQQMQRRRLSQSIVPGGRAFPVASAEDTILAKLDWYRIGGGTSERQWTDIKNLLLSQDDALDYVYMVQWARQTGVGDLLSRAVREVEAARQ